MAKWLGCWTQNSGTVPVLYLTLPDHYRRLYTYHHVVACLFVQHEREREHLSRRQIPGLERDQKEGEIIREYTAATLLEKPNDKHTTHFLQVSSE